MTLLTFVGITVAVALAAEPPAPLARERTIAFKSVTGRIDHLAVDLGRQRLFVAELGNGTVDAIDLASGSVIRRIEGLKGKRCGRDLLTVAVRRGRPIAAGGAGASLGASGRRRFLG